MLGYRTRAADGAPRPVVNPTSPDGPAIFTRHLVASRGHESLTPSLEAVSTTCSSAVRPDAISAGALLQQAVKPARGGTVAARRGCAHGGWPAGSPARKYE